MAAAVTVSVARRPLYSVPIRHSPADIDREAWLQNLRNHFVNDLRHRRIRECGMRSQVAKDHQIHLPKRDARLTVFGLEQERLRSFDSTQLLAVFGKIMQKLLG